MNTNIKKVFIVIVGFVVGSIVNSGLITIGHQIIALPDGANVSTYEKLKESMKMFTDKHYIFPFVAHALGTFVSAFIATKLNVEKTNKLAFIIGFIFLLGGILNCFLLPAPVWFIFLDLLIAYLPMAYLGWKLGK